MRQEEGSAAGLRRHLPAPGTRRPTATPPGPHDHKEVKIFYKRLIAFPSVLPLEELYFSSFSTPIMPHSHPLPGHRPPTSPVGQGRSCQEKSQLLGFAFRGLRDLPLTHIPSQPPACPTPAPRAGRLAGATAKLWLKMNSPPDQSQLSEDLPCFKVQCQIIILQSFQISFVRFNLFFPHILITPWASQTELHIFHVFPWEGRVRTVSGLTLML